MKNVSVSIIIITHDTYAIINCLKIIMEQIDMNDEIIVVDDHSSHSYFRFLKDYCKSNNIKLLKAKKCGNRAHNRNLGASQSKNPILLFIDADMLLFKSAISSVKRAYTTGDSLAYICIRCASRYDMFRMQFLNGINIQDIINQYEQCDFLSEIPALKDSRVTDTIYLDNVAEQRFYWIYYYTCCCTVLRKDFIQLGGFDENFIGWGVEDIDLGFRISLNGKVSFLRGFGGIHVPHDRELLFAEQDNCRNWKLLLKKFQRFDVEITSVYRISAKQLEKVSDLLSHMRTISTNVLVPDERKNIIYLDCVSFNFPNGQLKYVDKNGNHKVYNLIGISTFFEDKSITTVIVSANIVLYPLSIICGILQECLRIGKNVFIEGNMPNFRLDWRQFPNLINLQPQKRNEYRAHDIMEFQFKQYQEQNKIEVTSNYLDLELPKLSPIKLQLKKIKRNNTISNSYCAINLTYGTGYRILLNQMKEEFGINYVGIYCVYDDNELFYSNNTFPLHLYPILSLNTSILIIVENLDNFNFDFEVWNKRNHKNDILVDFNGKILIV